MKKTSTSQRRQVTAGVIDNIDLAPVHPGHFRLTVESDFLSSRAKPGQFLHILPPRTDEMLRRPLSILMADPDKKICTMLYRVIGEGTALLASAESGDELDIIGPLGNGFPVDVKNPAILVGGGVGIPPLVYLAKILMESGLSRESLRVYLGARDIATLVCVEDFNSLGIKPVLSLETEVGKFQKHPMWNYSGLVEGFVTDALNRTDAIPLSGSVIYSCGPILMLRAVSKWAAGNNLKCYASLENKLGCGIGACLGCSIPVHEHGGPVHYERVCVEGPVFDASRVAFDRM